MPDRAVFALAWWIYRLIKSTPSDLWRDEMREAVSRLLSYFQFTRYPLTPSHWVSLGLRRVVRGEIGVSLYYLALVWSNGLFFYLIAAAASARLYRRGYNRATTGGDLHSLAVRSQQGEPRPLGSGWEDRSLTVAARLADYRESLLDRLLYTVLFFVHPARALVIVKDFRTFRRDPQQWGQIWPLAV